MHPYDHCASHPEPLRPGPASDLSDELLDELDATMQRLGRIFASRHGDFDDCPALSGPRFMAVHSLADGPARVSDLAATLGVKAPAASAMVDNLVNEGLAERSPDPDDRRATLVSLTEAGREVYQVAESHRRMFLRRYCSVLSEDDVRSLIRIQNTMVEAMMADRI